MNGTPTRQSPIHHLLEARQPTWSRAGDVVVAVSFDSVEAERTAAQTLGLCDLSGLMKLGVKGGGCTTWLSSQGVEVPAKVYESQSLEDGGLIVRLAGDEFFLESGIANRTVPMLFERLGHKEPTAADVFRVERQDAAFLLVGSSAPDVLSQTCGINWHEAATRRLVLTRVAGVSCGVFPDTIAEIPAYRLWIDFSYAIYLWETLVQICEDLDGCVIGAGSLFPELL